MKVKNTIPLDNIHLVHCIADEVSLRFIESNPLAMISTIDPETLGIMTRFSVETYPHEFYEACIDNDCIYLPTKTGQILSIDKFSGKILSTMNLKSPIMSPVQQDKDHIYCVCGVPINTKYKLNTEKFCAFICDKETGQEKIQTNYFAGPAFLTISEDFLWIVSGNKLNRYHKNGELNKIINLITTPEYPVLLTGEYAILSYRDGTVRTFDQEDMSFVSVMQAKDNLSGGVLTHKNKIAWTYKNGICETDVISKTYQTSQTQQELTSEIIFSNKTNEIFSSSKEGHLLSFDLQKQQVRSVKLTNNNLGKFILLDNNLFVTSDKDLHQIEVK